MAAYLIDNCYSTFLCVSIILCFLLIYKDYEKEIKICFFILCALVLIENIGGSAEKYLGNQDSYSNWRLVLSWACYITGPAIMTGTIELLLRNSKRWIQVLIALPQFINIIVTTTCFFGPWCFTMNPEINSFTPGPLIFIPRMMPPLYLLLLIVAALFNVRKSRMESIIIIVGSIFVAFDYLDETVLFVSENLRETTISFMTVAYFMYFTAIRHMDTVKEMNENFAETEERYTKEMVDQSIETLSFTIDAKDRYTKGHSSRVAKYARMIARMAGKTPAECEQVYRAGLLHDIGKISISGSIINKAGKLTAEEFEKIKKHPENGAKILEKMKSIPYLQNGAMYHHERYDGGGYPEGLKGELIPEIARIISVADAYDAMTSYRSYRPTMDQAVVKQEIWKGIGTQFDPDFAKMMIALIDADVNYDMREKDEEEDAIVFDDYPEKPQWQEVIPKNLNVVQKRLQDTELNSLGAFVCSEDHWADPIGGVNVTMPAGQLRFTSKGREKANYVWCSPVILIYSSKDGKVMGPKYEELGVFMSAGYSWRTGSALTEKITFNKNKEFGSWDNWIEKNKTGMTYTVNYRKEANGVYIRINNELVTVDGYVELPEEYWRDVYLSVSGEQCDITIC